MTTAGFRRIALSMPEAAESAHMGHPDFRVNRRIFATIFTKDGVTHGMVKLTPEQQRGFVAAAAAAFQPIPGGWGAQGATQVNLKSVDQKRLRDAVFTAWSNVAPKRLRDGAEPPNPA